METKIATNNSITHNKTIRKNEFLFPLLPSPNATRVVLSYCDLFELESNISLLNRWVFRFVRQARNLQYLYGQPEIALRTLGRSISGASYNLNTCIFSDTKKLNSISLKEIPAHIQKFSALEITKNRMLVIGGYDKEKSEYISCMFEILSNGKVVEKPASHYPRISFSLCFVQGNVLIIGGYNNGILKLCEAVEPETSKISSLPSLNQKRCHPLLCEFEGWVYAFLGSDGYSGITTPERLKIGAEAWEFLPDVFSCYSVHTRIGGRAARISRNEILIFGGILEASRRPVLDCLIYNVSRKIITGTVRLTQGEPANHISIFYEHELLYAFGTRLQVYNCKEKLWRAI